MESKTKLLDQMRHVLRLKHLSIRTEKAYVQWAKRFILFHHKRHPADMGAPEIRAFLIYLAVEGEIAASTQNVALQALVPVSVTSTGTEAITGAPLLFQHVASTHAEKS